MSQLIANFIGEQLVSTQMFFRVRSKDVASPDSIPHDSEFFAAMEALVGSEYFRDTDIDYDNGISRGQLLGFAEEVDAQEVMLFVIETVAAQGWYFHGEGMGLLVFHQGDDADEVRISQVVVQPRDEDTTVTIRLVDVNVDSPTDDGEDFDGAITDFVGVQRGASSYRLVEQTQMRTYRFEPVLPRVFSPGDLLRIMTVLSRHGWIYHGEAEDNYVFFRQS